MPDINTDDMSTVELLKYENGDGDNLIETKEMSKDQYGVWNIILAGDWKNKSTEESMKAKSMSYSVKLSLVEDKEGPSLRN